MGQTDARNQLTAITHSSLHFFLTILDSYLENYIWQETVFTSNVNMHKYSMLNKYKELGEKLSKVLSQSKLC